MKSNSKSIFLIGPMAAGKSTLSRSLANLLKFPVINVDKYRWDFLKTTDYSKEKELYLHRAERI